MAQTFDTSRVGGGTYELEQDSNGNYKLKSVGFNQVNKLNLPDVKDLNLPKTTTTKDSTTTTTTADPFLKLSNQQQGGGEGGGQDYSDIMLKSPKVKDVSVRDAGESMTKIDTGKTDGKFLASGAAGGASLKGDKASDGFLASGAAGGASLSSKVEEQKPGMLSTPQQQQETFAARTTGLQNVTSAVSNTVENIMNNSATVAIAKGVGNVIKGISNAITSPEQQSINQENTTSLRNLGYQTNFQGKVIGKNGKSVSAADSVFGGMNSRSAFGDISKGAQSRVDTRNSKKTQERISKLSAEKQKAFNNKTKEFEKELMSHNNDRVASREDKSGATGKNKGGFTNPGANSYGPHSGGGGGDPGCFIKGTLITMANGSTKPVEQVDLEDKVAVGGKVFAVGRFLNTELYDYKGIKVSGSHMVNENGTWLRVRDTKHGKSLGDDLNTVYVFGSENRRILINEILFTDYFEVNEQDKLIEDSEDFFNNWKSYGNTIDEHNVNTLNAS